jgi:hypothetical protein
MAMASKSHTRILTLPHGENSLAGAWMDALREEVRDTGRDLVIDFQELRLTTPPRLFKAGAQIFEQIEGVYVPHRLRFQEVKFLEGRVQTLNRLPSHHPSREISASIQWHGPDHLNYYLIGLRSNNHPDLLFTARTCCAEERTGVLRETIFTRDWSPSPACPPRLIPRPTSLHHRCGGDPVAVWIGATLRRRRLFTGGIDIQPEQRPDVDAVLNLGELPSRWAGSAPQPECDRWVEKGEGSQGMNEDDLRSEAGWVIERLQAGQRVLVHCAAGMNRSATICCAVLILMEGLSAEAALERVREFHPWARPDSRHWLTLKWLARDQ